MHRLLYEKTGNARWISQLDMIRLFQRAFLRAGIAIKHSEGYHPHAYVSIALPLPVGQESCCELLDFAAVDGTPLSGIPARLNPVLPEGLRALDCFESSRKIRDLALLRAQITLEYDHGAPAPEQVAALFAQPALLVEKKTKNGPAQVDIRPLIRELTVQPCAGGLLLQALLCAQNPGLNPELLAAALRTHLPACAPDFVRVMRLEVFDAAGEPFR